MARIPAARMKIEVDGPALRIAALQAATNTVEGYTFPMSEGLFRNVVTGRAEHFLAWLREGQLDTLGQTDDTADSES